MENFIALSLPILMALALLKLMVLPVRLFWKLLVNSLCGFLCLWILNSVAGFTGLYFPINAVTAATAGFLGLPGIGLLATVQLFL